MCQSFIALPNLRKDAVNPQNQYTDFKRSERNYIAEPQTKPKHQSMFYYNPELWIGLWLLSALSNQSHACAWKKQ